MKWSRFRDEFLKSLTARQHNSSASAGRRFQFHKRSQLFIGTHHETLSVAMRVNDPDCAPIIVER
jgi:hypothetical protein